MNHDQQRRAANRNLSYKLAESLGQNILAGTYKPGSILPGEIELCDMYNISRTAVREAVKMLAAKGMVLPRPRIGTRVLPKENWNYLDQDLLTWIKLAEHPEMVTEFKYIRRIIEPEAAAMCALNATDEDRSRLQEIMQRMYDVNDNYNQNKWTEIDTQFHQLIYFASGNHFLSPFGNLFRAIFENYFMMVSRKGVERLEAHQRLVDAIIAKDSESARQATLEILDNN